MRASTVREVTGRAAEATNARAATGHPAVSSRANPATTATEDQRARTTAVTPAEGRVPVTRVTILLLLMSEVCADEARSSRAGQVVGADFASMSFNHLSVGAQPPVRLIA